MQKIVVEKLVVDLYKQENSGPNIAHKLSIPVKQIYNILDKEGVIRRSTSEQNEINFRNSPLSFSFKDDLSKKQRELLIAAIMLYCAEGAKTGSTVDIANSDERILTTFLLFLRELCKIDEKRLRCYLYCFSDQDSQKLINFWSEKLGISCANFTKPYVRISKSAGKDRIMPNGVLHIRYSDKRLLEKILQLSKDLLNQFTTAS